MRSGHQTKRGPVLEEGLELVRRVLLHARQNTGVGVHRERHAGVPETFRDHLHMDRNHGADFGRVLASFEVPVAERDEFATFLDRLGYPCVLESESDAYRMFLGRRGGDQA
jgi:hypothetical protein